MDLQLDVVRAPAKAACAERAQLGVMKARLSSTEIAYMADIATDIKFDADDCSKTPGTYVFGLIDGRAGVFLIRLDDSTGLPMAYAKGSSWPAATVEAIGRVVEGRWRP